MTNLFTDRVFKWSIGYEHLNQHLNVIVMKRTISNFFASILFIAITPCHAQQEILIVGDMHQVPKIAKRAYGPMLRKLLAYQPELIMAEFSKKGDTAAMGEWHSKFKEAHLAKKKVFEYDQAEMASLQKRPNHQLNEEQFKILREYYLSIGDHANHRMYGYFMSHGATKRFKPYGNQNPDLTFQLMRQLELKEIYGVDSHEGYAGYWPAWQRALEGGKEKGKKAFKKSMRKQDWKTIWAVMTKSLGRYTNTPSTLDAYYRLNSLRFLGFAGEDHALQQRKWDDRNTKMAKNILALLGEKKVKRSVLIVGAGHAKAIGDELQKHQENIKIIMYHDLKDHLKER